MSHAWNVSQRRLFKMRPIIFLILILTFGNSANAAAPSIDQTLGDMEIRDVLLEELEGCLEVMTTSACVKTYEEKCADFFSTDEDLMAGSMELDTEGESHPPGNTFIWRADQYEALSYTDDEFPSNFSDQVDLLTRE
jgi:hypothetical protein